MKLVLAEKPSVAQSIAKVLGAAKREDGYLEGNGYVVSWCVGHLVELAQPEVYDAKYSKWAYADLPIFPMDWQYEVCDKLQMSWAQVVQRIDGLIRKGRYLSPEEEAERQAIEEAKTDPLEDVYDRFAVIDTEDGEYAIWDNQTDDYYVDPEGVTEYFTDEWLANDYLMSSAPRF